MEKKVLFKVSFLLLTISFSSFPQQSTLSKIVNSVSAYIASEQFAELRREIGDIPSVDSIYVEALKISGYDYSETLLALTFATIPYREVPIKIPLFNIIFYYPLTSAGEDIFLLKDENQPRYLFMDTPKNKYGDKDKLAHFFGSAFISYSSIVFDLGNLIGYFVESFEQDFKIQSRIDKRDLRTNKLGKLFGNILKRNEKIMPSSIILSSIFYGIRF